MRTVHWPGPSRMSPMPTEVWATGLCIRHARPEIWTSSLPLEREKAASICAWCPALSVCRTWSLGLPWADNTIYGALDSKGRQQLRKASQEPALAPAGDEKITPAA